VCAMCVFVCVGPESAEREIGQERQSARRLPQKDDESTFKSHILWRQSDFFALCDQGQHGWALRPTRRVPSEIR